MPNPFSADLHPMNPSAVVATEIEIERFLRGSECVPMPKYSRKRHIQKSVDRANRPRTATMLLAVLILTLHLTELEHRLHCR